MIRVDRKALSRCEIVRMAANRFLNDGFTKTTVASMGKALHMSTGNMPFYFATKEHMLDARFNMLVKYQWGTLETEAGAGNSVMAVCLELLTIASACEQDEVAKDFFISTYTSPLCLEIIRKNDVERSKQVYKEYCSDWTDERFAEAETLVSGIEYGTLQQTESSAPLELRIGGALELILTIYNVPSDERKRLIEKVLAMDYKALGLRVLEDFRRYVDETTEQALHDLLKRIGTTE